MSWINHLEQKLVRITFASLSNFKHSWSCAGKHNCSVPEQLVCSHWRPCPILNHIKTHLWFQLHFGTNLNLPVLSLWSPTLPTVIKLPIPGHRMEARLARDGGWWLVAGGHLRGVFRLRLPGPGCTVVNLPHFRRTLWCWCYLSVMLPQCTAGWSPHLHTPRLQLVPASLCFILHLCSNHWRFMN